MVWLTCLHCAVCEWFVVIIGINRMHIFTNIILHKMRDFFTDIHICIVPIGISQSLVHVYV